MINKMPKPLRNCFILLIPKAVALIKRQITALKASSQTTDNWGKNMYKEDIAPIKDDSKILKVLSRFPIILELAKTKK